MKIIHNFKYLFLLLFFCLNAQNKLDSTFIKVKIKFEGLDFAKEKKYLSSQKDTLTFETIKFYLTNFQFNLKDKTSIKDPNSYHLIDFDEKESMNLAFDKIKEEELESIQFNIGVDSLTSVSGALNGDLDVTKGMYWAWQSGYINFKIEGKSPSCKTRKNLFHFHIGGYLDPYNSMRSIKIDYKSIDKEEINLILDLGKLFSEISLKDINTIMIPGKDAMKIADLSTKLFSLE